MSWIYVILAGILEIMFTTFLKYSYGFTKIIPSAIAVMAAFMSFVFFNKGLSGIPMGSAYLTWTAIGSVGTVVVGILIFDEPITLLRLFYIMAIILSIIGLKMC